MNPNRTTMNDMKRRVAGILEFIGRTQVEMATEMPLLPGSKTPSPPSREAKTAKRPVTPPEDEQQPGKGGKDLQPELQQQQKFISAVNAELDLEQFKHLGSLEMMEVLTRKLMKWQGEYGKYGEK